MAKNLPYVLVSGTLERMLEKIATASVPERFTQDFVSTKLALKGGTPRAIIPFIKKMGLVAGDGSPTELYKEFRNPSKSGAAMAKSMKTVYSTLFDMNEYANDLNDKDLRGLIVEATGAEKNSAAVTKTVSTFKVLKALAEFDQLEDNIETPTEVMDAEKQEAAVPIPLHVNAPGQNHSSAGEGINLSYTINLNLPPTTDIEVFNAIFKSLKEHLLQK